MSYRWAQTLGPTASLSDPTSASPSFIAPEVTADTTLTFSLQVDDGTAGSMPSTVTVTVRHVNRAPVASAGSNQTADERGTATLDGGASMDPDGDTLFYAWTQVGGPVVTLSDASAASPTFATPEVPADSVLTFALTVSDGSLTSTATVTVTVRHVNRAPVAAAGEGVTVSPGSFVTLDGLDSYDPDGSRLTYAWTQTDGPTVTLDDASSAKPGFTVPKDIKQDTSLTFKLTVTDDAGSTAVATVTVSVSIAGAGCGCTASNASTSGAMLPLLLLGAFACLRRRRHA